MTVRVLIVDDHPLTREALGSLLGANGFDVAGQAAGAREAIDLAGELRPDLIVLDLTMPDMDGLEALPELRRAAPDAEVVVLTASEDDGNLLAAIRAGASGYLTKESAASQLVAAIRKVAGGGAYITAEVAERLAQDAMPQAERPAHAALSDREFEVFHMIVDGMSVNEIAARLHLSAKTISTHKARLMEKLGVDSTAELVHYAVRHKLLDDSGQA